MSTQPKDNVGKHKLLTFHLICQLQYYVERDMVAYSFGYSKVIKLIIIIILLIYMCMKVDHLISL